jgi:hypothetical protein
MLIRFVVLTLAAIAFISLCDSAQAQRKGCGHGSTCFPETYPPEQVAHSSWCSSHFVVVNGVREHRCPAKWKNGKKPKR